MKRAIFPGSFDTLTLVHSDIIKIGVTLFDELIIAIGVNAKKKYMFSLEERMRFIQEAFKGESKIKVVTYKGLTVDFFKKAKLPVYGAFMNGVSAYETKIPEKGILVLGNEANGISAEVENMVDAKISIPQFGEITTESLNVATAASILLNELRRKS